MRAELHRKAQPCAPLHPEVLRGGRPLPSQAVPPELSSLPAPAMPLPTDSAEFSQRACVHVRTYDPSQSALTSAARQARGRGGRPHMRTGGRAFFLLAERRQHGECRCAGLLGWRPCRSTSAWEGETRAWNDAHRVLGGEWRGSLGGRSTELRSFRGARPPSAWRAVQAGCAWGLACAARPGQSGALESP